MRLCMVNVLRCKRPLIQHDNSERRPPADAPCGAFWILFSKLCNAYSILLHSFNSIKIADYVFKKRKKKCGFWGKKEK